MSSLAETAVIARAPGWLVVAACLAVACEVPARPDSWRAAKTHAPAAKDDGRVSALIGEEQAIASDLERRGDTLTVHLDHHPNHLNPMVSPSTWTVRISHGAIFEPLLVHVPRGPAGGAAEYEPALASSISVSPDGLTLRLELRENVQFHDGRPLTAADAVFSLETARAGRAGARHLRDHLADVVAVKARGERGLELRLRRPSAFALRALAQVPIMPRHVYEGAMRAAPGAVVGTGPYELERWDEDGVYLSRFSDYWGDPAGIAHIVFLHVPDAAAALTLARRGAIDLMPALISEHIREQLEAPGFAGDFTELRLRPPALSVLAMNGRRGPLQDPQVRRALALAIDRGALISTAHGGLAWAAPGPVWPGGPVNGPPMPPLPHDPEAAARLLDAAGWEVGDGGVRSRAGERLRLSLLATEDEDPTRTQVMADLRAIGVLVGTRIGPSAVLSGRMRQGDFDLALVDWHGDVDRDPTPLLGDVFSVDDPELAEALRAVRDAGSTRQRAAAAGGLAAAFARTVPFVPLTAPEPRGMIASRVRGVQVWNGWVDLAGLELAP